VSLAHLRRSTFGSLLAIGLLVVSAPARGQSPASDSPAAESAPESDVAARPRLVARVFSFRYAPRLSLESEDLKIQRQERDASGHLERILDELSQREVINTGVIATPDVRFYPVSIDRFIREILDQEFKD